MFEEGVVRTSRTNRLLNLMNSLQLALRWWSNSDFENLYLTYERQARHIYYIVADGLDAAKNSPHLEVFRKKGIEVLLLHDQIDEWLVSHVPAFEEKNFQSVAKGDLSSLDDEESKQETEQLEEKKKEFDSILKQAKEILSERVQDVQLTRRLTDSPSCLTVADDQMSTHLKWYKMPVKPCLMSSRL